MPLSFLPSLLLLLFLSISLLRRIRESGKIVIRFFDGFGWKEKTRALFRIFLFFSSTFGLNELMNRSGKISLRLGDRQQRLLVSHERHTSLYFVRVFFSLSLLGLCELVNHSTKKKLQFVSGIDSSWPAWEIRNRVISMFDLCTNLFLSYLSFPFFSFFLFFFC